MVLLVHADAVVNGDEACVLYVRRCRRVPPPVPSYFFSSSAQRRQLERNGEQVVLSLPPYHFPQCSLLGAQLWCRGSTCYQPPQPPAARCRSATWCRSHIAARLAAASMYASAAGDRHLQPGEPRQPSQWCRSESSHRQFIPPKHPKHLDFLKRLECDIFCRNWVLQVSATRWRATTLSAGKLEDIF